MRTPPARKPAGGLRLQAAKALGRVGTAEDLARLEKCAEIDWSLDVREAARKAAEEIRKRAGS